MVEMIEVAWNKTSIVVGGEEVGSITYAGGDYWAGRATVNGVSIAQNRNNKTACERVMRQLVERVVTTGTIKPQGDIFDRVKQNLNKQA